MNELSQKIQNALLDNPRTKDASIEILDENGVVTLKGIVDSPETSRTAESIVQNLDGVATVVNEIQVRKDDDDDPLSPGRWTRTFS